MDFEAINNRILVMLQFVLWYSPSKKKIFYIFKLAGSLATYKFLLESTEGLIMRLMLSLAKSYSYLFSKENISEPGNVLNVGIIISLDINKTILTVGYTHLP